MIYQTYRSKLSGAYAGVFQRRGEQPTIDIVSFDGQRNIDELQELIRIATEAMTEAKRR